MDENVSYACIEGFYGAFLQRIAAINIADVPPLVSVSQNNQIWQANTKRFSHNFAICAWIFFISSLDYIVSGSSCIFFENTAPISFVECYFNNTV